VAANGGRSLIFLLSTGGPTEPLAEPGFKNTGIDLVV